MKKIKKESVIQAVKFTAFSLSAGVIQLCSTTLLNEVCHLYYPIAYAIGLVLSVLWNFTFNRKFTFKSANNVPIAMLLTLAYYVVFGPLSYYTTYVLYPKGKAPLTPIPEIVMTILMMLVNFVTEFFYQKFVVFRKKPEEKTQETAQENQTEKTSEAQSEKAENSSKENIDNPSKEEINNSPTEKKSTKKEKRDK